MVDSLLSECLHSVLTFVLNFMFELELWYHPWTGVVLFPGLPRFYFLFPCTIIHRSRRLAKSGEGLGAFIMLVDARWTDEGLIVKYIGMHWTSKQVTYWSRQVLLFTLRSEGQNCGRGLEQMILHIALAVGFLHPYVHLASTWHHSCDECSQVIFCQSSALMYYCECKWKVEKPRRPGNKTRTRE